MPLFGTQVDEFTTNQLATLWPDSYGPVTVANGVGVVPSTADYYGIQTDNTYTLNASSVYVQVTPAPANGAVVEAFTELQISTATAGTDATINYSAVTGNITFNLRVGYVDAGTVTLAYSATTHKWWRIRVVGANILWDTSADGLTWTNRRTAAAPAWVSNVDLWCKLVAHRDDGVANEAYFDNFNATPATVARPMVAGTGSVGAEAIRTGSSISRPLVAGTAQIPAPVKSTGSRTSPGPVSATSAQPNEAVAGHASPQPARVNGTSSVALGAASGTVTRTAGIVAVGTQIPLAVADTTTWATAPRATGTSSIASAQISTSSSVSATSAATNASVPAAVLSAGATTAPSGVAGNSSMLVASAGSGATAVVQRVTGSTSIYSVGFTSEATPGPSSVAAATSVASVGLSSVALAAVSRVNLAAQVPQADGSTGSSLLVGHHAATSQILSALVGNGAIAEAVRVNGSASVGTADLSTSFSLEATAVQATTELPFSSITAGSGTGVPTEDVRVLATAYDATLSAGALTVLPQVAGQISVSAPGVSGTVDTSHETPEAVSAVGAASLINSADAPAGVAGCSSTIEAVSASGGAVVEYGHLVAPSAVPDAGLSTGATLGAQTLNCASETLAFVVEVNSNVDLAATRAQTNSTIDSVGISTGAGATGGDFAATASVESASFSLGAGPEPTSITVPSAVLPPEAQTSSTSTPQRVAGSGAVLSSLLSTGVRLAQSQLLGMATALDPGISTGAGPTGPVEALRGVSVTFGPVLGTGATPTPSHVTGTSPVASPVLSLSKAIDADRVPALGGVFAGDISTGGTPTPGLVLARASSAETPPEAGRILDITEVGPPGSRYGWSSSGVRARWGARVE